MIAGRFNKPICYLAGMGDADNSPDPLGVMIDHYYQTAKFLVEGSSEQYQPGVTPTTWAGFMAALNNDPSYHQYMQIVTYPGYENWAAAQHANDPSQSYGINPPVAYVPGIGWGGIGWNPGYQVDFFDVRDSNQSGVTMPDQHAIVRFTNMNGKLGLARIFDAGDAGWRDMLIPMAALVAIIAVAAVGAAAAGGAGADAGGGADAAAAGEGESAAGATGEGASGAEAGSTTETFSVSQPAVQVSSITTDPLTSVPGWSSYLPSPGAIAGKVGSAAVSTAIGKIIGALSPAPKVSHPVPPMQRVPGSYPPVMEIPTYVNQQGMGTGLSSNSLLLVAAGLAALILLKRK